MRSIKELLQLMLDNKYLFSTGLCNWKDELLFKNIITDYEHGGLERYIRIHRPSMFSSINAFYYRNRMYYWTMRDIKPRIKWLEKHIKLNS